MPIFTLHEIFDMLLIIIASGYIFKDVVRPRVAPVDYNRDPVAYYQQMGTKQDMFEGFALAALVTAPAILLHELGHKFFAMGFGLEATLHASYMWLGIALLMKILSFGFIFLVPAFVSYPTTASYAQTAMIAFAGPAVNLLLWLGSWLALKRKVTKSAKWLVALRLTQSINMLLFIINMIPIPPFDGGHGFMALWHIFAG